MPHEALYVLRYQDRHHQNGQVLYCHCPEKFIVFRITVQILKELPDISVHHLIDVDRIEHVLDSLIMSEHTYNSNSEDPEAADKFIEPVKEDADGSASVLFQSFFIYVLHTLIVVLLLEHSQDVQFSLAGLQFLVQLLFSRVLLLGLALPYDLRDKGREKSLLFLNLLALISLTLGLHYCQFGKEHEHFSFPSFLLKNLSEKLV